MATDTKSKPDTRDAETQRLTSHLNAFRLTTPESESVESVEVKPDETELPADSAKVIELLREAQALPVKTRTEFTIRQNRINRISQHLHTIQQGTPVPVITSHNSRNVADAQSNNADQMQLESLARQFPVVRSLVNELKDVEAHIQRAVASSRADADASHELLVETDKQISELAFKLAERDASLTSAAGQINAAASKIAALENEITALKNPKS